MDDVTIDSWMPSLPRPKIKPGVFSPPADEVIEMSENGHIDSDRTVGRAAVYYMCYVTLVPAAACRHLRCF